MFQALVLLACSIMLAYSLCLCVCACAWLSLSLSLSRCMCVLGLVSLSAYGAGAWAWTVWAIRKLQQLTLSCRRFQFQTFPIERIIGITNRNRKYLCIHIEIELRASSSDCICVCSVLAHCKRVLVLVNSINWLHFSAPLISISHVRNCIYLICCNTHTHIHTHTHSHTTELKTCFWKPKTFVNM